MVPWTLEKLGWGADSIMRTPPSNTGPSWVPHACLDSMVKGGEHRPSRTEGRAPDMPDCGEGASEACAVSVQGLCARRPHLGPGRRPAGTPATAAPGPRQPKSSVPQQLHGWGPDTSALSPGKFTP